MPVCFEYPIAAPMPLSGTPITTSASTADSFARTDPILYLTS